jgi:flagellar biosynthesis chaperone FliJ
MATTEETIPKDYRDPVATKNELKTKEAQLRLNEDALEQTSRSVLAATGKLAKLRKMRKEYAKNAETQNLAGYLQSSLREIDKQVEKQEKLVADLLDRESRQQRIVEARKQQLADFLRQSPHPKLKTNKAFLSDFGIVRALRDELARI